MTRAELRQHLIGKTIRDVTFAGKADPFGRPYKESDLPVESIEFMDGSTLLLQGSPQIDMDEVFAILEPPAMRL